MKSKEDVVKGLENFPKTLLKLFNGENLGKLVLQVAKEQEKLQETLSGIVMPTSDCHAGPDPASMPHKRLTRRAPHGLRLKAAMTR